MANIATLKVEKGDYQDDPCASTDPINKVNHETWHRNYVIDYSQPNLIFFCFLMFTQVDLVSYLSEFLKKFSGDDSQYFTMLCQVS